MRPLVAITEAQVEDAWAAYAATKKMAAQDTALLDNEFFLALQDTAFARFLGYMEAL